MMLVIDNLRVAYGKIRALHGVSLAVEAGEIVCVLGANGAGKSTLLRAISRMVEAEKGSVLRFGGRDLLGLPPERVVSQLGISHVPEGRRLFGNLTVQENLRLAAFARRDREAVDRDTERVFVIFPRLKERAGQKAGTLSGGEQQMLAIGRAFVSGRKLMLLDEPSMGLAPLLMMSVFEALREINRAEGTAILLVEQNARLALQFASRGYVLENGHMVLAGDSQILLYDENVKKAYLGG